MTVNKIKNIFNNATSTTKSAFNTASSSVRSAGKKLILLIPDNYSPPRPPEPPKKSLSLFFFKK
ncbi:hypothetical protein ACISSW_28640, partial [Escherichia coli]